MKERLKGNLNQKLRKAKDRVDHDKEIQVAQQSKVAAPAQHVQSYLKD